MVNPNIDAFNGDVAANGGYRYTTNAPLSSRLANQRMTNVSLAFAEPRGRIFIDVGCGDGTFAVALYDQGQPDRIHGLDPAELAIGVAKQRVGARRISFFVGSADQLPYADNSFDWAYLRGVLHHMNRPVDALREALRVANRVLVVEPTRSGGEKCVSLPRAEFSFLCFPFSLEFSC